MRTLVLTALIGVVAFPTTSRALKGNLHQHTQDAIHRSAGIPKNTPNQNRYLKVEKAFGGSRLTLTFPVAQKREAPTDSKASYVASPREMTQVKIVLRMLDGALPKVEGKPAAGTPKPSPLSRARITLTRGRSEVWGQQASNEARPTFKAWNELGDKTMGYHTQIEKLIPSNAELMVGAKDMKAFLSLFKQSGMQQVIDEMATHWNPAINSIADLLANETRNLASE